MGNEYPHHYTMTVSFRLDEHEKQELTDILERLDSPVDETSIDADQEYENFLLEIIEGTRGITTNVELKD